MLCVLNNEFIYRLTITTAEDKQIHTFTCIFADFNVFESIKKGPVF